MRRAMNFGQDIAVYAETGNTTVIELGFHVRTISYDPSSRPRFEKGSRGHVFTKGMIVMGAKDPSLGRNLCLSNT